MNFNDTIIGQNTNVSGNLKCTADIFVGGHVDGLVYSDQNIIIMEKGVVKGQAESMEFTLNGTLEGKVKAKKIYLTPSARLLGDLITNTLKIDAGASFIGHSKKIDQEKDSKLNNTDLIYEI
ncbi:MAG: polymer-forming cytoskeletal protein [Patescibacteria group bacterium]